MSDLFDDERQSTKEYRIYGYINFVSMINGVNTQYGTLKEFFIKPRLGEEELGQTKNVLNCFDVYLCKLWTGSTNIVDSKYQLKLQILTNIDNFEIYKSGFAKTIFYNQIYSYNFNIDVDVYNQYDSFGKPIMDLYLFFNYKPSGSETVKMKTFDTSSDEITNSTTSKPYVIYSAGNIIDGDLVDYLVSNYSENLINKQEYYVKLPCLNENSILTHLEFKYYPLQQIPLQYFNSEPTTGNISGTTETDYNIPDHAVILDQYGNYIWKEILPHGFIDPLTGEGVNHSFVNKKHYVFNEVILDMEANLNDTTTNVNLSGIIFEPNTILKNKPNNLNKFGKKC